MSMNDEQQKLVTDNIALVHFLIRKHYPTFYSNEDVVQNGMVGLCKAAKYWDSSKSTFSTYAGKCILNEIKNHFRESILAQSVLSLDYEYEGGMMLSEAIEGDTDVDSTFEVEEFLGKEKEKNKLVLSLYAQGYTTREISEMTGIGVRGVARIKRIAQKKWEGVCDYETERAKYSNQIPHRY